MLTKPSCGAQKADIRFTTSIMMNSIAKSNANDSTKTASSPTNTLSTVITQLHPYDVLCNRSRSAFNYIGNRRFRVIVESYAVSYAELTSKSERSQVVLSIVKNVHQCGGRFLTKIGMDKWQEVSMVRAKEKVGHALRFSISSRMQGEARTIHDVLGGVDSFSEEQPRKKHKLELKQAPALEAEAATCNDHEQRRPSEFSLLDSCIHDSAAFAIFCESLYYCLNIDEVNGVVVVPDNKISSLTCEYDLLDEDVENMGMDHNLLDDMEVLMNCPPERVGSDCCSWLDEQVWWEVDDSPDSAVFLACDSSDALISGAFGWFNLILREVHSKVTMFGAITAAFYWNNNPCIECERTSEGSSKMQIENCFYRLSNVTTRGCSRFSRSQRHSVPCVSKHSLCKRKFIHNLWGVSSKMGIHSQIICTLTSPFLFGMHVITFYNFVLCCELWIGAECLEGLISRRFFCPKRSCRSGFALIDRGHQDIIWHLLLKGQAGFEIKSRS